MVFEDKAFSELTAPFEQYPCSSFRHAKLNALSGSPLPEITSRATCSVVKFGLLKNPWLSLYFMIFAFDLLHFVTVAHTLAHRSAQLLPLSAVPSCRFLRFADLLLRRRRVLPYIPQLLDASAWTGSGRRGGQSAQTALGEFGFHGSPPRFGASAFHDREGYVFVTGRGRWQAKNR